MKKRNPQDATLRNIRSLKEKHSALKERVKRLEQAMKALAYFVKRVR